MARVPGSLRRQPPGGLASARGPVLLALTVLLISALPLASSTPAPGSPSAVAPGPQLTAPSPNHAPGPGLAGSSGGGRFVNGPAIYRADHSRSGPLATLLANLSGGNATTTDRTAVSPRDLGRPLSRPGVPGGWLTGTVVDSVYMTPISGADVQITEPGGLCNNCSPGPVSTNATGFFRIEGDPGPAILTFNDSEYVGNQTNATVLSAIVTPVGTVEMVHLATVVGTVVADLRHTPPVGGADVTSESRDGELGGPDQTVTAANGSFSLAVDPIAIQVEIGGGGPGLYLANSTYAFPAPWSTVDVGTVELEGGINATLRVVDSVTGAPVNATVIFCTDQVDGACFPPRGSTVANGSNATGVVNFSAVAGPGSVEVAAPGYETNVTQVADVPVRPASVVNVGTVELVPYGALEVTVNYTGGTPNGTWSSGGLTLIDCTLTGADTGAGTVGGSPLPTCTDESASLGQTELIPAAPLRTVLFLYDGDSNLPGFPLAVLSFPGGQPWPPWPYEYANITWANVTPDRVTDLGNFNAEPGTYLSGTIQLSGSLENVTGVPVTVDVCSTVRTGECLASVETGAGGQDYPLGVPTGCPTAAYEFCAPAPPGPDEVDISWGAAHAGTWITVPFRCCSQQGDPTDVGVFPLDRNVGAVHGSIGEEGAPANATPLGGWNAGVSVCPVTSPAQCFGAPAASNGSFSSPAALGWDVVTANALGYRANYTWIDVAGNNTTGEIEVAPYASYTGRVVDAATGLPVLQAVVTACNVAPIQPCFPSTTVVGSNGTYLGTAPITAFPASSVQVTVTASGFDPESTFLNLTPGISSVAPTIRLPEVGVAGGLGPGFGPRSSNSSAPTTGSWVVGRVVDPENGIGVGNAALSVCLLVAAGSCSFTTSRTLTGGEFNLSTVHGAYEVWVNASHFATAHVYLNASVAGTVDVGVVPLTPLVWISGRVLIGPWDSLASQYGEGADEVTVIACDPAGTCGPAGVTSPGGYFNVSGPASPAETLQLTGGGPTSYGNSLTGFNGTRLTLAATIPYTRYNGSGPDGAVDLEVLAAVAGYLTEVAGSARPPAFFSTFGVESGGTPPALASFVTGGGGYYVGFLPGGSTSITAAGSAGGLVPARANVSIGTLAAGEVVTGPTIAMTEFGFVNATVRTAGTHVPISGVGVVLSGRGGPTNQPLAGSALSNGTDFVNVSAPPGVDSIVTGAQAFANFSGNTTVVARTPDAFGPIDLTPLAGGGVADVRSVEVNSVGVPLTPGAFDNVTGHPVLALEVSEQSSGGIDENPVFGSDLGQYYLSALPADAPNITFSALGYSPTTLHSYLLPGTDLVEPQLNLTANGVLAGTVVAEPGNVSVPYATVEVCPVGTPLCLNHVETNVSGVFWIGAAAGVDQVSVDSPLYLSNVSKLVNVTPDSFTEVGNVPVFTFGTVQGFVRALPRGNFLVGANVSICSKYSGPGGCLPDETVATDANGSFTIQSPPGTYYLYADEPGYNATRYPLVLSPGVNLNVGTMFLQSYGEVLGDVVNATGAPVPGATVLPCPAYAGPCGGAGPTDGNGSYAVATPPGPNTLTVSASGYLDATEAIVVISGGVVRAPEIVLSQVPPDVLENVTGVVTSAATGVGLPNALLVAQEGGVRVAQAVSGTAGAYRFEVRWGTVTIVAGEPDYRSMNTTVTVHENVTNVNFALAAMTYLVEGVTTDGGTGSLLSGVVLANNGTVVARSDANGVYQLQLPNGTTTFSASYSTNGTVQYGTVSVAITVTGGSVQHNIALPRTEVPLGGVVVNAETGRPVPAASVSLWTASGRGEGSRSTDASGAFTFGPGPGTYNVSVTAPGFVATNVTISTGTVGNYTTVSLEPVSSATGGAGISPLELAVIAGGAVAVGLAASVAIRAGRARGPPREPAAEELLPNYEEEAPT
jgi:hypothetical protein